MPAIAGMRPGTCPRTQRCAHSKVRLLGTCPRTQLRDRSGRHTSEDWAARPSDCLPAAALDTGASLAVAGLEAAAAAGRAAGFVTFGAAADAVAFVGAAARDSELALTAAG